MADRPPALSAEERERRRGGLSPVDLLGDPFAADRHRAIADMEEARRTHAEWAAFLRANPDWKGDKHVPDPSAMVGTPEEEDEWVAKYDNVLAVLRAGGG